MIEDILGGIVKQAEAAGLKKTAAAAKAVGLPDDSAILQMSEEDLLQVAERIETRGQTGDAAERIVAMRKTANHGQASGPSGLAIALEMQKIAYRRAAENLGLISKTASEDVGVHQILNLMFSGDHPLDKLAEAAAIFEFNRLTNQ
jgi:hypothetical protein